MSMWRISQIGIECHDMDLWCFSIDGELRILKLVIVVVADLLMWDKRVIFMIFIVDVKVIKVKTVTLHQPL